MKLKKIGISILLGISTIGLSACDLSNIFKSDSSKPSNTQDTVKKGLFLYRTDTGEEIKTNSEVAMEMYNDFYFTLKLDGEEVVPTSITSSDNTIIYAHSRSVYPRKVGNATITIKYNKATGETTTFTINATSSFNDSVKEIYVSNGADGIFIKDNGDAEITSKLYGKCENGIVKCLPIDTNVTLASEETTDANFKKVTITYTENGKNNIVSYNVRKTNNTNPITRTTLKQGFNTYYTNGVYHNYPCLNSTGDLKILVIPIWFADSNEVINTTRTDLNGKTHKQQIIEDLDQCLFGDPLRKNEQTLKSYYYDESFGQLKVTGTVSDWYETSYDSSINYINNKTAYETLAVNAYEWYFSNHSEPESTYDCVMLSYGTNHYGDANNGYSAFQFSMKNTEHPYLKRCIFSSALGMYFIGNGDDGFQDIDDLSDLNYNDALHPITEIHEFAHTMGAIDIYSDKRVNGVASSPAGNISMQSSDKTGHDVFNLLGFGWAKPYVLSNDDSDLGNEITLTIGDIQSSGDCVILTPSWNSYDSPFDEYIAIELFSENGVNTYEQTLLKQNGLRVYHVDARLANVDSQLITSNAEMSRTILPFTNTAGVANGTGNYSFLREYEDMDLLHLIRSSGKNQKGEEISYITSDGGREFNWFKAKDTFSLEQFKKQFYIEGKLDSNTDLGWTFKVNSITLNEDGSSKASITFKKASL